MAGDEPVIMLGEEAAGPGPPGKVEPRSWRLNLILVLAALVAAIAHLFTPDDFARTTVDPFGLAAPTEPSPVIPAVPETAVGPARNASPLAVGWQAVDLAGSAWQLPGIDHGPDGWLAVSQGPTLIAHTSDDATVWLSRTLDDFDGFNPEVTVGDGIMAVAASGYPGAETGATAMISTDGGVSWIPSRISDGGALVTDLEAIGADLYAAGAVGDTDRFVDDGAVALWRSSGTKWTRLDADPAATGVINAIVPAPGGYPWVFGHDESGPRGWRATDEGIEPLELDIPVGHQGRAFIDVVYDGNRYVALMGARGFATSGRELLTSHDGSIWSELVRAGSDLVAIEAPGDGSLLGRMAEGGHVWVLAAGVESVVTDFWDGDGQRLAGIPYVGAIAADDGVTVVGGSRDSGVGMMVRGAAGTPSSEVAAPAEPRWRVLSRLGVSAAGEFGWPMAVVSGDDGTLVVVPGQVLSVEGVDSPEPVLTPVLADPTGAGVGPGGVWVSSGSPGATLLHTRRPDGTWGSEELPLISVEAIGAVDGVEVAVGWDADGHRVIRRSTSGEWVPDDDHLPGIHGGVALDEGFLARREGGRPAVVSRDGRHWEELDLELGGGWGGAPFLFDPADPSLVTLVDRWPETEVIETPLDIVWSIQRSGTDLAITGPGGLFVGNATHGWDRFPLDIEHGVDGTPLPIPAGTPMLAVVSDGSVTIVRWDG